jgi:hypothetical protein
MPKPISEALLSLQFTVWPLAAVLFSLAASDNAISSPLVFLDWLGSHWFAVLAGLVVNPGPYYRARQAVLAQNDVTFSFPPQSKGS